MRNHLKKAHCLNDPTAGESSTGFHGKFDDYVHQGIVGKHRVFNQEEFRKRLVKYVVRTHQPFLITETPELCDLLSYCHPEALTPSADTAKRWVDEAYSDLKAAIKSVLNVKY